MRHTRGIAFKLILYILTSCAVIFSAIFGYNYLLSRRIIECKIEENAGNLTLRTVNKIESVLNAVKKVPENVACALEESNYTKEGILNLLRAVVENNAEIYGSTISYEPYMFDKNARLFGPYYYKRGGKLSFASLAGDYNYVVWDWYTVPKKLGSPVWTEPYFDKGGGNIIMSTYSVPFYRNVDGKRRFAGVVTADVYLSRLQDIVSSVKIGRTGYAFLVSRDGTIVTHPRRDLIMKAKLSDLAESRHDQQLSRLAAAMALGKRGFEPSTSIVTGKKCWIAYEPISSTGWSLGVVFPQDELMADVTSLSWTVLVLGLAGIAFLLVVIVAISGSITRPLRALAGATKNIGRGDLDFPVPPIRPGDEVGALASSFAYMRDSLKDYIHKLTEATAARERIESELKIARDIQMGMVPKEIPPFPGRNEVDIRAMLEPAREVGGDLYDFFFIDDARLCFLVGDVSGKGVPAALFMARTITLIKATAREVMRPEEIMDRVNKELSLHNDSCMFVTVFCGILNVTNGELRYVNAGHNPPLIVRGDKEAEFLKGGESTVLGVEEDAAYSQETIFLSPGDTLCLYTDGVTEAFDREGEMFSEERLHDEISARRGESVAELAMDTMQMVKTYSSGAPQSDDITIVVLRYLDRVTEASCRGKAAIKIKNRIDSISALAGEIASFGERRRLPDDVLHDVRLALEEVVVNVIHYAYEDEREHEITVRMSVKEREVVLEVRDDGKPFNPLDVPPPDLDKPPEERGAGGLGIFLARKFMDSVEYRRVGGENVLVMKKKIGESDAD
jgi:sigma-B regulation protein RsbU (phosphoserine phosphatase)